VDDTKTRNALIDQVVRSQWAFVEILAWERPPVNVKIRLTLRVGQGCPLPTSVPTEQLEILDCVSQVRKYIRVVIPSNSNKRNTSLRECSRSRLNSTERLRIPVFLINKVTRNNDRIHSLRHSRLRDIGPDRSRREVGRIEPTWEPTGSTPDMTIRDTENLC
jgi:hypothetical protein